MSGWSGTNTDPIHKEERMGWVLESCAQTAGLVPCCRALYLLLSPCPFILLQAMWEFQKHGASILASLHEGSFHFESTFGACGLPFLQALLSLLFGFQGACRHELRRRNCGSLIKRLAYCGVLAEDRYENIPKITSYMHYTVRRFGGRLALTGFLCACFCMGPYLL